MIKKIQNIFGDSDFSELFKKGGTSFFLRIIGQALGFILILLIARNFGSETLGEYVLIIIILRIFTLFAKLGMDTTSLRMTASFAIQNKWRSFFLFRRKVLMVSLVSSLFMSLLMYFLSYEIASIIKKGASLSEIQSLSIKIKIAAFFILPFVSFILHYQFLRGLKKITEYSFFYWVSQTIFTLIALVLFTQFAIQDQHPELPIYCYLFSIIIVSIMAFFSYYINFNDKCKLTEKEINKVSFRQILGISIPLMFAQSGQMIMVWTDKLMLGSLESPDTINGLMTTSQQVGVYHVIFKLSMFASITLMAVNSIASSKFAELYVEKNFIVLKKVVQQSTKLIFWSSIPLILLFFLFPHVFLSFFGEKEFVSDIAISSFIILSIGKLINAFCGSVGNLLQMTGKQLIFMNVLFVGAILNIILNLILIPKLGIKGAALASLCSIAFWNLTMVYFVKKEFGFLTFYIPFIQNERKK